jgi:hypothetical protein
MKRYSLITLAGLLILALAFGINAVLAAPEPAPVSQASDLHPNFILLDADGVNVLESGNTVSTMLTCGQCHDTEFIAAHAFHSDLGLSDYDSASVTFDSSNGLFGQWNPLTYRYLSPAGDEHLDLSTAEWLMLNGARVVGGGPATTSRGGEALTDLSASKSDPETAILNADGTISTWDWKASGTMEMNCFLCHLETPNNEARVKEIEAGKFGNANTATLLGLNIVRKTGSDWAWNAEAFNELGEVNSEMLRIQDPTNSNCASCHGEVHAEETPLTINACDLDYPQTATTGQVVSAQRINQSGVNLSARMISPARGIFMPSVSWNAPTAITRSTILPMQVKRRARTQVTCCMIRARWRSVNISNAPTTTLHAAKARSSTSRLNTKARCAAARTAMITAKVTDWLPYIETHMDAIACETCHIPQMYAPAIQAYDWTVVTTEGSAVETCRGVEGDPNAVTSLVTGYQPVLLNRTNIDGDSLLAPYNLITSYYWVYDDANGNPRPLRLVDLEAVYLDNGMYAADIVSAFDANSDGKLSDAELVIDTPEKEVLVRRRSPHWGLPTRASKPLPSHTASTTTSHRARMRSTIARPVTTQTRASPSPSNSRTMLPPCRISTSTTMSMGLANLSSPKMARCITNPNLKMTICTSSAPAASAGSTGSAR